MSLALTLADATTQPLNYKDRWGSKPPENSFVEKSGWEAGRVGERMFERRRLSEGERE